MAPTAKGSEQLDELFAHAEKAVASYFERKREDPARGQIDIDGQRYVLVRAPSLSVDFYDLMETLYQGQKIHAHAVGRNLLFHLAHFVGRSDARAFHQKMGLENPMEKLSAGPVHFAHAGWASVDIHPESKPVPGEDFYLVYDHPYSFESDAWREAGRLAPQPICFMNAGYSSGWCEESFDTRLVATELLCVAKGDPCCRFIMGHPSRMDEHVRKYLDTHSDVAALVTDFEVPGEFEHRELEQRLQLSESRFRQLFDTAMDAIVILRRGKIDHVNRRASELFRTPRLQLQGTTLADLVPPSQPDGRPSARALDSRLDAALQGEPQSFSFNFVDSMDETIVTEISLNQVEGRDGDLLAVIRDVTERQRLAQEVRQLQKMESLGTLAGGIAHNFNNLLTSITGNLQLLRRELERDSTASKRLEDAQLALDRASGVVRHMLTLSRTSQDLKEVISVEALVDENLRMLKEVLDPRVSIVARSQGASVSMLGDSNYLSQVIVNLALNARDAILSRLETAAEAEDYWPEIVLETALESGVLRPGETEPVDDESFVRITVADNGSGMDAATSARAFEPFFTTKPTGQGTGLGLATVYGIVQQHGGWIDLDSDPGRGTRVSLYLPQGSGGPQSPPSEPPPETELSGTETILFVDDEASLRKLVGIVLDLHGYTMLPAGDGAEAMRVFEVEHSHIDCVVLDLVMPRMSGRETLRRIRRRDPELPVILSSGYSTEGTAQGLMELGAVAFLPKPYGVDDLVRLVRKAIDDRKRKQGSAD